MELVCEDHPVQHATKDTTKTCACRRGVNIMIRPPNEPACTCSIHVLGGQPNNTYGGGGWWQLESCACLTGSHGSRPPGCALLLPGDQGTKYNQKKIEKYAPKDHPLSGNREDIRSREFFVNASSDGHLFGKRKLYLESP